MFYIGRGSYNISGNHELEDPTVSKTVRTAQITALSNRFDKDKHFQYIVGNRTGGRDDSGL